MRRHTLYIGALAALLIAAVAAEARMHAPYRGHRIIPANAAPLDAFTAPSGAYSFRKLHSAYSGAGLRIRRASDNAEIDVGFDGAGGFDSATAVTHCAATSCFAAKWYDQSGNVRDLVMATAANQPELVLSCANSLPCLETTTATMSLSAGTFTPATGTVSMSVVANRVSGTAACTLFRENASAGNRLLTTNAVAHRWTLFGGTSGSIVGVANDAAWHVGQAVMAGAASSLTIDGVAATPSTVTGSVVAGAFSFTGAAATSCRHAEIVVWDNYSLTPSEIAALTENQRNYWAPAPLDSFTTPSGAYSFRKLKTTYAGNAIKLRRTTGGTQDIAFLGCTGFTGCPWDEAAALAFCNATTCFADTWYSQEPAVRDLVQATAANQPQLIFNCNGSLPCLSMTTATMGMSAAGNVTPATGLVSFSVVSARTVYASNCAFLRENGNNNRITAAAAANTWSMGPSGPTLAAADNVWHAANAVLSPTAGASVLNVDGTEATGTGTPNTTAGAPSTFGSAGTTCRIAEAVFWDNYTLTPAERAALIVNQRRFWGTP